MRLKSVLSESIRGVKCEHTGGEIALAGAFEGIQVLVVLSGTTNLICQGGSPRVGV